MSKVEGISLREAIFTPSRGRDLHPLDDEKKGQVTHDAPFTIVSPGDGDVKGRLHRRTPVFLHRGIPPRRVARSEGASLHREVIRFRS